jgi:uncharacterized membrane protein
MTLLRTDLIPNLYANLIADVSQASPAVVTVPVVARVVSTTGTIGTVTGSGTTSAPWTATLTLMTTTAGLKSGDVITATAGTGTFAAGGEVSVKAITGNQAITINKIGGTIPTAGTVTNVSLPAVSTLPPLLASGDVIQITGVENATLTFTQSASTGTFQVGQTITQATSGANAVITGVNYNGSSSTLTVNTVEGTFDTTHLVSGPALGLPLTPIPAPTMTPTAVVGMTELLTAGAGGSNAFFVDVLTSTTFALYTNVGLTTEVDSSAFTTAVANTGQYTTIDAVEITVAP